MNYKTFEDMKNDIPEGATHYQNETDNEFFSFFKRVDGVNYHYCPGFMCKWVELGDQGEMLEDCVKPIPQTETPEEKEAFDSMANNSELPNSSEWKNGDECLHTHHDYAKNPHMTYIGQHPFINDLHICLSHLKGVITVSSCYLAKPETPQQRKERERLENGRALFELVQGIWSDVDDRYEAHPYDSPIVDGVTKEMYARLASELNYRKAK